MRARIKTNEKAKKPRVEKPQGEEEESGITHEVHIAALTLQSIFSFVKSSRLRVDVAPGGVRILIVFKK